MSIHKLNMTFSKKDIQYILTIALSALVYAFGIESFVSSGNLFPGGFVTTRCNASGKTSWFRNSIWCHLLGNEFYGCAIYLESYWA